MARKQKKEPVFLSDVRDEIDDRAPGLPLWWRGPTHTTGRLPSHELREMANADCRFLDEDPS